MKNAFMVVLLIAISVPTHAAGKRTELDGVWILLRADIGKVQLTPEGEKKRAAYDFQKDDPDFQCKPASITRIMHTPSPPIEVRQHPDHVEINYEFMDVHRRVPLKKGLVPKDAPYAVRELSAFRQIGRTVSTARLWSLKLPVRRAGVLDTLGVPGLYQSDQMRTVEHFIPDGDRMQIVVTHQDPVYFVQPLTVTFNYLRLPGGKIEKWGCKPEEATFERFIPSKK